MRNPTLLATVLVLLTPALAGCLDGPSPGAEAEGLQAPEWRVGDQWTYRITRESGERWDITHEVVDVTALEGIDVYEVRVTETSPYEGGSWENTTRYFEVGTLSEVGACEGPRADRTCGERIPVFAFPLHDGKAWTWTPPAPPEGYDDVEVRALAEPAPEGTPMPVAVEGDPGEVWSIVHESGPDAPEGGVRITLTYAEHVGYLTEMVVESDGGDGGTERRVLTDYARR